MGLFFYHLKLELLTQFPASNDKKKLYLCKNIRLQNVIIRLSKHLLQNIFEISHTIRVKSSENWWFYFGFLICLYPMVILRSWYKITDFLMILAWLSPSIYLVWNLFENVYIRFGQHNGWNVSAIRGWRNQYFITSYCINNILLKTLLLCGFFFQKVPLVKTE